MSMLPEWMRETDNYVPPKDGGTFAIKTIQTIGKIMSRLKTQAGHEKQKHLPALVKLFAMILLIVLTSVCQNRIILMVIAAAVLGYLLVDANITLANAQVEYASNCVQTMHAVE